MSDIRFEGWLHRSGTGGVYQDSAGNVGIASTQPQQKLDIGNGGFQVGPTGIMTATEINYTGSQNLSHRNLIINGAMNVAQRGTSSTSAGYETVDRIETSVNDLDEVPTFAQVDVASGTTPYTSGFRKAFKMTNGNQTGGAGSLDKSEVHYKIEAQDIANSGWNYTSSSSFVTLSFWVKSSVAQNFFGHLKTTDGTAYNYPFETGALTADTWTKVVKKIPGNSNLQIDNDTGVGLTILFYGFMGTSLTGSVSLDTWAAYVSSTRTPDQTSTWHTTNDATLEFTGLQLEVGSQATPFEHRSFGEELALCQRYYIRIATGTGKGISENATQYNSCSVFLSIPLPTEMRAQPTLEITSGTGHFVKYANNGPVYIDTFGRDGVTTTKLLCINGTGSGTAGHACMVRTDDASTYIGAISEL